MDRRPRRPAPAAGGAPAIERACGTRFGLTQSRHDGARQAVWRDRARRLAAKDGKIAWVGFAADLPGRRMRSRVRCALLKCAWITPGLVDCHTHLVFGGDRAREFEMRLQGASYEEIARAGGGIVSTVAATRAASREELAESAARRLAGLTREGVTTVEIKSGYGLDLETEIQNA
jgi:imidazolonepropionase